MAEGKGFYCGYERKNGKRRLDGSRGEEEINRLDLARAVRVREGRLERKQRETNGSRERQCIIKIAWGREAHELRKFRGACGVGEKGLDFKICTMYLRYQHKFDMLMGATGRHVSSARHEGNDLW